MDAVRRIEYDRFGDPTRLRLADFTPRAPRRGEVQVRVAAAAANAMDWKIRRGDMRWATGRRLPRGVGQDLAGTVLQIGPGVEELAVGEAVFGAAGMAAGAFAEVVVVKTGNLARKPDGLSFEQAAALPVVGLTALQALDRGEIHAGRRVFVNGALGGVGQAAVQLARARGALVSGSVRDVGSPAITRTGMETVVGFDVDPDAFDREFDLVLDTAGTLPLTTTLRLLAPGGRALDIVPTPAKVLHSLRHRQYRLHMGRLNERDLQVLARHVTSGALDLAIARTVTLEDAIPALSELELEGTPKGGKLVIVP
ncbi:NADP-dependent oxidoreductase [Auraticoccus monumenti]|uniref:NADPH:quinone reductase n=1 Tax=Auraticoccus monumenti TaxID=675864 RepID=A0A1G6V003_9ACTN|nr:NADP-dependent oxidoreductase [Auraticoccus monumenti]SDD46841.1 NADPH:quinone reductase [Auraticoccus monumenti]